MSDVTRILGAMAGGDPHAADQLWPLVYDELRRLAAQKLAHEKPGQTLDATALVHAAYLRLVASPGRESGVGRFEGRGHFFAAAAEAMRRILVEAARRKSRLKRGGNLAREALADEPASPERPERLLALDEALAWTPARWSPASRPSARPWRSWTTRISPRSSTPARLASPVASAPGGPTSSWSWYAASPSPRSVTPTG